MRGRKPVPTALKVLRGNPGQRKLNPHEPIPEMLAEDVPPEVISDPAARAEWDRTIVPAIRRGQVTAADRSIAIAHCALWATWQSQVLEADRHPHIIAVGESKHPMPNPARGMANTTLGLLLKVDAEMGLTPSARSRVHVVTTTPEPVSKWRGLLG